jgi:hypothetical protein
MRFDLGPTPYERFEARKRWHRWFAWHPVRIDRQVVWLETVERKGEWIFDSLGGDWAWEYRLPAGSANDPTEEESFLKDVAEHQMTVLRDDGRDQHTQRRLKNGNQNTTTPTHSLEREGGASAATHVAPVQRETDRPHARPQHRSRALQGVGDGP